MGLLGSSAFVHFVQSATRQAQEVPSWELLRRKQWYHLCPSLFLLFPLSPRLCPGGSSILYSCLLFCAPKILQGLIPLLYKADKFTHRLTKTIYSSLTFFCLWLILEGHFSWLNLVLHFGHATLGST